MKISTKLAFYCNGGGGLLQTCRRYKSQLLFFHKLKSQVPKNQHYLIPLSFLLFAADDANPSFR